MKNFNQYHITKTKAAFVDDVKKKLTPKSFYERHILTVNLSKFLSIILSVVSVIAGITALFSLFMMMFGIDDTLLGVFTSNPIFAYSLAVVAAILLGLIEVGKHHFHTEGLMERFRNTDDNGKMEKRVAFSFTLISCVLSVAGGVLIANELAGTKTQSKILAIESQWQPKIEEQTALLKEYQGNSYKNRQGKTLYKMLPVIEETKQQLSTLQNNYQSALVNAGVSDKVGMAYDSNATFATAALLGGLQVFVEVLLFACLYWIVWFNYRVFTEETTTEDNTTDEETTTTNGIYYQPFAAATNPPIHNNQHTQPSGHTVVQGFTNRYKQQQQPPTQPTQPKQTPQPIVTQQPQVQTKVFDYSQTRSNLKMYWNRINKKGYSDKKFKGIKRYAGALIENGYRIDIDYINNEPSLTIDYKHSPTLQPNEKYLIEYEGQVRIYYPDLIEEYLAVDTHHSEG